MRAVLTTVGPLWTAGDPLGRVRALQGAVRVARSSRTPQPRISVNATPGLALAGDRIDVLAMASNEHGQVLRGLWLGLVLPGCAEIGTVVPPTGSAAVPDLLDGKVVLRCPLPDLAPGATAGLDVELLAPAVSGRFGVTAFVTVDVDPALTLTATRVLPVL